MTARRLNALVIVADSAAELAQAEAELTAEGVPVAHVFEEYQRAYLVADGYELPGPERLLMEPCQP